MKVSACLICFVWLLCITDGKHGRAQAILYDNLDNVRDLREDWLTPLGSDDRLAQQFLTGDNTTLDQVTILLQRPQGGSTGSLRFELWRDNGSGQPIPPDDPTGKIADLGTVVDVTQIPVGRFSEFTFDNLVLGLDPNQPYWIVTEFALAGNNNVGVAVNSDPYWDPNNPNPLDYDTAAGTNGAVSMHGNRRPDPSWESLLEFFSARHFYQAMKVEARADSEPMDIDSLSSAVRQGMTDVEHDVNRDGLVDADDRKYWIQSTVKTYFGDANLDGEFNSSDLTTVFQAGEYDDNITLNSTWREGDWNGDGDFESSDLITAFQDGGYEQGPRNALETVPEPTTTVLLVCGLASLAICRRQAGM